MLPAHGCLAGNKFVCWMSCDHESTNECVRCTEKNSSYITMPHWTLDSPTLPSLCYNTYCTAIILYTHLLVTHQTCVTGLCSTENNDAAVQGGFIKSATIESVDEILNFFLVCFLSTILLFISPLYM